MHLTGYENFEFTVFANAIGALYRRNKQTERINLLEVDRSSGKDASSGIGSMLTTAGILAAASAILIAAVTGFISLRANSIDEQTAKVEEDIAKLQAQVKANEVLHNRLEIINRYKNYVQTVQLDLDTKPQLIQTKFDKIKEVMEANGATYSEIAFDLDTGAYTISPITVDKKEDYEKLIDDLKALDFVADITYAGYRVQTPRDLKPGEEVKEEDTKIQLDSLILYFMEEEKEGE